MRPLDFAIIGAQKSATTTLNDRLAYHPDIYLPEQKEIAFFARPELYDRGAEYLETFYRARTHERCAGIAYVHLLSFPESACRLRDHNPQIKLIGVLRNPIDRAYSAYWYARRTGRESSRTFEESLQREPERRAGDFFSVADFSYVYHGHYDELLEQYYRVLPTEQLRILLMEDLSANEDEILEDLMTWLGVDPRLVAGRGAAASNPASLPKSMTIQRMLFTPETGLKDVYRRLVSPRMRYWIYRKLTRRVIRANLRPFRYPEMNPETRERLRDHFAPHNDKLERRLGRSLAHWR